MYHADNVLSSVVKWEGKCLLNFDLNSSIWNKQEAELQFEFEFKNYILDKLSVEQGCPTLFLEIYLPAEFSSNPDQTQLNQLIRIWRSTW